MASANADLDAVKIEIAGDVIAWIERMRWHSARNVIATDVNEWNCSLY